jgi:MFS family permease
MFRATPEIKEFVQEGEAPVIAPPATSTLSPKETLLTSSSKESENVILQRKLVDYGRRVWKRVGLMVIILFTILSALAVNALVQSILQGLSPNKEHTSLVLLIISQLLYAILVSSLLIISVFLVMRREARQEAEIIKAQNMRRQAMDLQDIVI